ncbi:hypothetical protein V6C42_08310 [Pseudoclostridium thermosuccinogenes]|jgi:GT2 family glycosyltransferase|uniref:hypothetical protein n=1 Tax=Clostridium thermosuccinogenes TaxID=84032 RepID=UPI002FDA086F
MGRILITVINYSNEAEVLRYAQMLSKQTVSSEIDLVIVNNKKSLNSKINLEKEIKEIEMSIEIYDPGENLGYLNGCLYGYREYRKRYKSIPEWVIVSNTDIDIPNRSFFEKFLAKKYDKEVWCIAPSVYSPKNKSYDNPHYVNRCSLRKINRVIWINERPICALFYHKLAKIKAKTKRKSKQPSQYVYSVHGCFFALKYEFVDKIKDIYYEGFLYSEEAYIAEYIRIFGKKSFYDDSLEVTHRENSVTGLLNIERKSRLIANSLKYIRDKFYIGE